MSTYFSLIPSGILENKNISDGSKITYALILGLSNRYGYCFATNSYLASMRYVSISTISRQILELKSQNAIITELGSKSNRRITPIISPSIIEKSLKASKNKQYNPFNDDIDNALDEVWRKIK